MSSSDPPADPGQPLTGETVRKRAVAGVMLVGLRGMAIRLIGLLGYLVLARLLAKEDFGIAALGLTFTLFGQLLADAGIRAALLRRPDAPSDRLLAAVLGFQAVVATLFTLGVSVWAVVAQTEVAIAVTIFAASLIPYSWRVPALVSLERRLEYRPLVTAEVAEVAVFNVLGVTAAAVGFGVTGVAVAAVLKILVGTALMLRLGRTPFMRPRVDFGAVRDLLKVGVGFQANSAVMVAREQAWASGIAAVGGLAVLGLWTIAARVCSVPGLLLETLWRVGYPAVARLLESGDDPRPTLERGCETAALIAPLMLVPLAAAGADGVEVLLGAEWREAADVFPFVAAALALRLPVSVVATGYLFAVERVRTVLGAQIALSVTVLVAGAIALPTIGYWGLGLAWLIGSTADALILGVALKRRSGVSPWPHVGRALVAGAVAVVAAAALDRAITAGALPEAAIATAVSLGLYAGIAFMLSPDGALRAVRVLRNGVTGARGRTVAAASPS